MGNKSLEIKTATIEIKVVRVDGHKMTKATFRQIEHDRESVVPVESILGWISDDGLYIIFGDDGKVKRRCINHWQNYAYDLNGRRMHRHSSYPNAGDGDAEAIDALVSYVKEICDQLFIAT